MRDFMNIVEGEVKTYTLYHGTCSDMLCQTGWEPNNTTQGGNMGQTQYLYLTNHPDNARWFAQEKGCDIVLVVRDVPSNYLRVDPEDGSTDTVEDELSFSMGIPGSVVLTQPLPADHFEVWTGA